MARQRQIIHLRLVSDSYKAVTWKYLRWVQERGDCHLTCKFGLWLYYFKCSV